MKDLLLLFADVMPREQIVELLEKDIAKYKADPTDENYKGIAVSCMLATAKLGIEEKGLDNLTAEMNERQKSHEAFSMHKKES